jgi:hypothetical protein
MLLAIASLPSFIKNEMKEGYKLHTHKMTTTVTMPTFFHQLQINNKFSRVKPQVKLVIQLYCHELEPHNMMIV